ncbi:T9SS sorting signal type C domain-containing protein [Flavobacterium sp.]|uniref:T9SS sorting signal type C domain-containing protein n=1 Tax=Flavobacterium sp. TaxID=239 RepID=UPI003D0A804E
MIQKLLLIIRLSFLKSSDSFSGKSFSSSVKLFCLGMFFAVQFGFGQTVLVDDSTPTTGKNYKVPAGINSVKIEVWGAGGGGGGSKNNGRGGSGGGGGGYSTKIITVVPGQTITYTVGAGGAGGNTGNGTIGNNSTVTHTPSALSLRANGGALGTQSNNAVNSGGLGGEATGADITVSGDLNLTGANGGSGGDVPAGNGGNGANSINTGGTGATNGVGNAGKVPGGGGGGGENDGLAKAGGAGANGKVKITSQLTYIAKILGATYGSDTWCSGETRTVNVEIQNIGTATWTDSSPDINIGVKWNTNGAINGADYYVRTNAGNLAPGSTRVYSIPFTASNNVGAGYTTTLSTGINNLTFDLVSEQIAWFAGNINGVGPGNVVFKTSDITIINVPDNKTIAAVPSPICSGSSSNIRVDLSQVGVSYQLRDASNASIGSAVAGTGATINLSTGNLTATTTFNVLASSCGNSVQMPGTVTVTVNQPPTISNAGPDQTASSSSFTLGANTPTVGTGMWSIVSGPSTALSQFSSTTNPTAIFNRAAVGTYVLRWTISNGSVCSSSTDDVVIANCSGNLITNGDFSASSTAWSPATSVPGSVVEINQETTYFSTGNSDATAELDSGASLRQSVTVIPGVSYTLNFLYARRPGAPDPVAVDIKIIGGSSSTSAFFSTSSITTPQTGSFTFTATSSSISIEFYNSLAGSSTYGAIIDNIVLLPSNQVAPVATTVPKGTYKTLTTCLNESVQLDVDNVAASGVTYSWTTTSTGATFTSATNIKNPTVTFSTIGLKEFKVIATTAGGCASSPSSTYVNVIAAPTVFAVTGGGSYCTGGTGVLVGLVGSTSGISYQLQKDGVNTGTSITGPTSGSAINFGPQTAAGIYTVVAKNTSTNCTSNMSGNAVITINPLPTISGNLNICKSTTTSLAGSGTANSTNPWTSASTSVATVSNTGVVTGVAAGTSVIRYTNNNGCSVTATVTVNSLPTTPTLGTITNVSCASLGSVILNNLPGGNWTINQTGFASASYSPMPGTSSYTVTGLAAGGYYFTVNNGTCTSTQTALITIADQPTVTWNGTTWLGGTPDATKKAIVTSVSPNQPFTTDVTACSLTITSSNPVIVSSGVTLTITNAVTSNGQLTFKNNSSLVQSNDVANSGDIYYERISTPILQKDYIYWSTPVNPQRLIDVSSSTTATKYYGNDGTQWVQTNRTNNMVIGKGYIIRGPDTYNNISRQTYTALFKGVPNNGNLQGEVLTAGNYHLIGNPYPSALSVDDLIDQNAILNGTVYFWTHNTPAKPTPSQQYTVDDYAAYNLSGGVSAKSDGQHSDIPGNDSGKKPTGFVAAGQAFFVNILSPGGRVNFNNSMREGAATNSQFFRSTNTSKKEAIEKHRIWLNMTNATGAFKQVLVGYIQGATNEYDTKYDGISFDANPYLDFYSLNNTEKFVIQGRALPFTDSDTVALGYRTTTESDFTIAIDEVDQNMNSQKIYLEDKTTGVIHDLTTGNYTFKSAIGTFTDRFVLRYTNKTLGTGDFENLENGILVSVKSKVINVLSSKENIKEVTIFDISGKQLYNKKKVGNTELQIQNLPSANQVLLVKVTLENDFTTTRKIIFQ